MRWTYATFYVLAFPSLFGKKEGPPHSLHKTEYHDERYDTALIPGSVAGEPTYDFIRDKYEQKKEGGGSASSPHPFSCEVNGCTSQDNDRG
jgi:hypothetical protein